MHKCLELTQDGEADLMSVLENVKDTLVNQPAQHRAWIVCLSNKLDFVMRKTKACRVCGRMGVGVPLLHVKGKDCIVTWYVDVDDRLKKRVDTLLQARGVYV